MGELPAREPVASFAAIGITAFTTTRAAGDFALGDGEPLASGVARWQQLVGELAPQSVRLASARQVHGVKVLDQGDDFTGWRRAEDADGHFSRAGGTALAITIADCVPVFLAHPAGAVAVLHAGWRGTAGRIVAAGLARFADVGLAAEEVLMHVGPGICGRCYEVGPEVFEKLTGWTTVRNRNVDLRALLAEQGREGGVRQITSSPSCTRCDNDQFFSHRCGDAGRQVAVIGVPPTAR